MKKTLKAKIVPITEVAPDEFVDTSMTDLTINLSPQAGTTITAAQVPYCPKCFTQMGKNKDGQWYCECWKWLDGE